MKPSRRELGLLLPALAAAMPAAADDKKMTDSKIWKFEDLPVKRNGQNLSRDVFAGATHTGFAIDMHITELGPGQAPHPSHHHAHEELLMLETGELDVTIGGKTTHITAGSVVYAASNQEHGWRNPGKAPARYFVLALGREPGA